MIEYLINQIEYIDYRSFYIISQFQCFREIEQDLVNVSFLLLVAIRDIKFEVCVQELR